MILRVFDDIVRFRAVSSIVVRRDGTADSLRELQTERATARAEADSPGE